MLSNTSTWCSGSTLTSWKALIWRPKNCMKSVWCSWCTENNFHRPSWIPIPFHWHFYFTLIWRPFYVWRLEPWRLSQRPDWSFDVIFIRARKVFWYSQLGSLLTSQSERRDRGVHLTSLHVLWHPGEKLTWRPACSRQQSCRPLTALADVGPSAFLSMRSWSLDPSRMSAPSRRFSPLHLEFKGTSSRDFRLPVFNESVSPKLLSVPLGPFRIFSQILGDICISRCNTGVNDIGGKWKKSSIRKVC